MKKITLTLMSLMMTFGLMNVNAQSPISFGVKAEANTSNFFLTDLDNQTSTMKVGANLGGFMKIDLHENFALQPEVSVFYRQSKMEAGSSEDTFQQWGMQVPVYALAQTNVGLGKLYGGVGPFVGLGFDAKYDKADVDQYKEVSGKTPMNRWDFGVGALVGYELFNGFQVNASYQLGLINQLDALKDDAKMRTQTVNFGIGYRF